MPTSSCGLRPGGGGSRSVPSTIGQQVGSTRIAVRFLRTKVYGLLSAPRPCSVIYSLDLGISGPPWRQGVGQVSNGDSQRGRHGHVRLPFVRRGWRMQQDTTPVERAFQLAKSGDFVTVPAIRRQLRAEGYSDSQMTGRALTQQLHASIRAARGHLTGAANSGQSEA